MWPVSRHSETLAGSVSWRKRSTCAWVPTWLSAWGWTAAVTPYSSSRILPRREVAATSVRHPCMSSSGGSVKLPSRSRYPSGSRTTWLAPAVVQAPEHGLAGDLEPSPVDLVAEPGRVGRQVAVGTQLEPPVACLGQLVEEPRPVRLRRVGGEPHAPRVRAAPQPEVGPGPGRFRFRHRRTSSRAAELGDVLLDPLAVLDRGLASPLLPREDADGGDAVELQLRQRPEERVPVDFALAEVEGRVDPGRRARRVDDVAQPRGRAVVEGVGDVQVGQQGPGVPHDAGDVAALVEGVRRAVQEGDDVVVDPADQLHRRSAVLHEVVGVRFKPELQALALEDRE